MSIKRIQVLDILCPSRGHEAGDGDWRSDSAEPRSRAAQLVKRSVDHMLRQLDQPFRVSTLSSMAGFSNSHFFVLFKSATGYAPKKFFIRLRMQHACKMLMTPGISVKEVASALGYRDPFYFSRLFKSVIGIAPSDYRQKLISSTQSPMPHDGCQSSQKNSNLESAFMNSVGLMSEVSA